LCLVAALIGTVAGRAWKDEATGPDGEQPAIARSIATHPVTGASPETSEPPLNPSTAMSQLPSTAARSEPAGDVRYTFPLTGLGPIEFGPGAEGHGYPAVDIFADVGTVFVAPISGVVDFVCREDVWDPAVDDGATKSGLAVAIIGDDGLRYYGSHLDQVHPDLDVGDRVVTGQALGAVGRSGNARNTPPHLHFGISEPTSPEDWETRRGTIDPFDALVAWQRGDSTFSPTTTADD
jgi:murein DD-endopeptidase MepM/ murein hydrolase activator NlpD